MRFKIFVDYYPKNIFLGNVFNNGISKEKSGEGLLKPRVRKYHLSGLSLLCSFHKTILILLPNHA